jgi:predicted amidophosphoribosyltransferase
MDSGDLVRDAFELLIVVAIGGMLWSVLSRLRRGELRVPACPECGGPASRAYPVCRHCGTELPEGR